MSVQRLAVGQGLRIRALEDADFRDLPWMNCQVSQTLLSVGLLGARCRVRPGCM